MSCTHCERMPSTFLVTQPYEVGSVIISVFQMKKRRFRDAEQRVRHHTAANLGQPSQYNSTSCNPIWVYLWPRIACWTITWMFSNIRKIWNTGVNFSSVVLVYIGYAFKLSEQGVIWLIDCILKYINWKLKDNVKTLFLRHMKLYYRTKYCNGYSGQLGIRSLALPLMCGGLWACNSASVNLISRVDQELVATCESFENEIPKHV